MPSSLLTGIPKPPQMSGLPKGQTLSIGKPYKKRPLNIHKMLLTKVKKLASNGAFNPIK